jgi:preprotein translocase subunit SecF
MVSKNITDLRLKKSLIILLIAFISPVISRADGFKFKIKNTAKTNVTVFYKISKRSGDFKLKSLARLQSGEEMIKSVSVNKGDTIAFYGQNPGDETSAIVKKDYEVLSKTKNEVTLIPIVIPDKGYPQLLST